ncbi:MAG: N-acetylmuramoyl-L-alanine amidase [Planctomycetia bacterium]|nr:N-acetylmuramoyl-L-alanine amidase [Planctomycetia bacterium]
MRLFDFLLVTLITATLAAVIVVFRDDAIPYPVDRPAALSSASRTPRPWAGILVHSTGAPRGSLRSLETAYAGRGGAPFHFVIGNGTETADGLVEEGPRWALQSRALNADMIEICLVGALDREKPTRKQQAALEALCARLCREKLIPASEVYGEGEKKKGVPCPGRFWDAQGTRAAVRSILAR